MGCLREKGVLVYPVYSRRAGGLSVGINLFPDQKRCSFDCPYCEVFPFSNNAVFSLEQMERDLLAVADSAKERNEIVKDFCFSGSGEPSLSPDFPSALKSASRIRDENVESAALVLITNGMGLLEPYIFSLLQDAATSPPFLDIWLKLDAGTPGWYQKINAAPVPHEELTTKIKEFAACTPVTIQTMLCSVDGEKPPQDEAQAWEKLVLELIKTNGMVRKVQIYGKARPSPDDPKSAALPVEYLEQRAASLRGLLTSDPQSPHPQIEVYP